MLNDCISNNSNQSKIYLFSRCNRRQEGTRQNSPLEKKVLLHCHVLDAQNLHYPLKFRSILLLSSFSTLGHPTSVAGCGWLAFFFGCTLYSRMGETVRNGSGPGFFWGDGFWRPSLLSPLSLSLSLFLRPPEIGN